MIKKITTLVISVFTLLAGVWVQPCPASTGSGSSSGIILTFDNNPRAEAMGGAFTALADSEAGAVGWNPAGLYRAFRQDISAMFYHGLLDDSLTALSFSMPYGLDWSFGVNLMAYDAGTFEWLQDNGTSQNLSAERDYTAAISAAYDLLDLIGYEVLVGVNIKGIYSDLLERATAYSVAGDLGFQYQLKELTRDLRVGLALRNVGLPMTYLEASEPLPMEARLGLAYSLKHLLGQDLVVAGDLVYTLDENLRANVGAEYWYAKMLAIRAGYKFGYSLDTFSVGLGFRYRMVQLDYAFTYMSDMNSLHKIALTYTLASDPQRQQWVEKVRPRKTPKPTPTPAPKPVAAPAAQPAPTAAPTPEPPIMSEILEMGKVGDQVKNVILSVGKNKRLRPGWRGVIISNGQTIASVEIKEVYATRSLALVKEQSGEITSTCQVEIYKK